jgi:hypothetical protein
MGFIKLNNKNPLLSIRRELAIGLVTLPISKHDASGISTVQKENVCC